MRRTRTENGETEEYGPMRFGFKGERNNLGFSSEKPSISIRFIHASATPPKRRDEMLGVKIKVRGDGARMVPYSPLSVFIPWPAGL